MFFFVPDYQRICYAIYNFKHLIRYTKPLILHLFLDFSDVTWKNMT